MRIEENKVVTLEFNVYDKDDNEMLESTSDLGPFFYIHGIGAFIPKIEESLEGKAKGFKTVVEMTPEEGYGEYDEELVDTMQKSEFVEFDDIYEGMEFIADMDDGTEQSYVITSIDDEVVTIDGNHPFSGRNLKFEITVTDIREATDEELEHGHPHFDGISDEMLDA
ncbi:MAG: FKBP-type peptidyl-prolyl cis-trans isomerase [Fusobacteriaceae bacterium]|nr:FKBP-type peptidyl-prolyl cis-trans isomerase [Fusobacteriaceae bacterium]MBP6323074.1 FKBP-type peptidyl-prolyl cis-trans isomerase [Fusobacteriaceae bacterium]MBP9510777.1 FKBP-type peptidyl-prolyl cis-trans isomerase [Fusobacteriaceae bacterium]